CDAAWMKTPGDRTATSRANSVASSKDSKVSKDNRDSKDSKVSRGNKDSKDDKGSRDNKGKVRGNSRVRAVSRDSKGMKGSREISRADRMPAAAVRVVAVIVRAATAHGTIAS